MLSNASETQTHHRHQKLRSVPCLPLWLYFSFQQNELNRWEQVILPFVRFCLSKDTKHPLEGEGGTPICNQLLNFLLQLYLIVIITMSFAKLMRVFLPLVIRWETKTWFFFLTTSKLNAVYFICDIKIILNMFR